VEKKKILDIDVFENGDRYNGEYEGGVPNGKGVYVWKNESVYEGEFKGGLKDGKGVWRKNGNEVKCN
jgi:hypothetical protein